MILLYGYADDPTLQLVHEACQRSGVEHLLVDQRESFEFEAAWRLGLIEGRFGVAGRECVLSAVRGVFARPLHAADSLIHEVVINWIDAAPCRVASRPSAMASNTSKPFQAQLIAEIGLDVPTTLITSDPDAVLRFWRLHGDVVFKSVSSVRSIVRKLDDKSAAELHRVRSLPTQFQEWIDGTDVRVHVVGRRTFAMEVRSPAVDYRYASRTGQDAELAACELPEEIAAKCVVLARHLDLPLSGIDLRRRGDGTFVCFEVNPMPGFSYYEHNTGQSIAEAVVNYLIEG